MLSSLREAVIGQRLNPQAPKHPPWFEGYYIRVVSPQHSFGLVTGYFPGQTPKHAAAYTGLLLNDDARQGKLQTWQSYRPQSDQLVVDKGVEPNVFGATAETNFCMEDTSPQRVVKIAGKGSNLLFEGTVDRAKLTIHSLAASQPWTQGGGSPQGLLHLIPGIGLHWYVHSTSTPVEFEFHVPSASTSSATGNAGTPITSRVLQGRGIAHIEKNWGGRKAFDAVAKPLLLLYLPDMPAYICEAARSFPRSFLWSQGFATSNSVAVPNPCNNGFGSNGNGNLQDGHGNSSSDLNNNSSSSSSLRGDSPADEFETQASFCLAGGVLPTFNVDKLPLPLPDTLLLGYRSQHRTWHFKPQSPALLSATVIPEEGLLVVKAQQLTRALVLRIQACLNSFSRVGGPTRSGFVPHSVQSYSAKAIAECYENGQLVEVTHFDRTALEFGGSYACSLEEAAGRSCGCLVCEPQHEE